MVIMAIMKQNTTDLAFLIRKMTIKIAVITYYGKSLNNGHVPETGSSIIACSKHFLLIYVVFQGLYYSNKIDRFCLQVRVAPDDRLLANARHMIVKPKFILISYI